MKSAMETRSIAIKFASFVAVSGLLMLLLVNTMSRGLPPGFTVYRAVFSDASGLKVGSDVRIAGVRVGAVQNIEVVGDTARITFAVDPADRIETTTGLILKYQSLVGQKYLSISDAVGGRPLAPGATIPLERTSSGFDLTALLNGFRPLFQVLRPQDVNALSESIIKVLQGEGGTVASLLTQTTQLTNYLADRDQVFHQVATNLIPVLQEVAGNGAQLTDTVHQLAMLTTSLAGNRATIMSSIDQMSALMDRVDSTLAQIRDPLSRDIATLQQVAQLYASTKDQYGAAPIDFGKVLDVLGRISSYRSANNIYYCNITLLVSGVKVNTDPPGSKYSQECK